MIPIKEFSNTAAEHDGSRCHHSVSYARHMKELYANKPASVARRNARERNRVKQVNNGFNVLKQHLPFSGKSRKMSKVETLRRAVEYIKSLQKLLGYCQNEIDASCKVDYAGSDDSSRTSEKSGCDGGYKLPVGFHPMYVAAPHGRFERCQQDNGSCCKNCLFQSSCDALCSVNVCSCRSPNFLDTFPTLPPLDRKQPLGSRDDEDLLESIMYWQQS